MILSDRQPISWATTPIAQNHSNHSKHVAMILSDMHLSLGRQVPDTLNQSNTHRTKIPCYGLRNMDSHQATISTQHNLLKMTKQNLICIATNNSYAIFLKS